MTHGVIFSLMLLFLYPDGTSNVITIQPKVFSGPSGIEECENARLRASMTRGSDGLIQAFPHCEGF
jgi:hypothetical protein